MLSRQSPKIGRAPGSGSVVGFGSGAVLGFVVLGLMCATGCGEPSKSSNQATSIGEVIMGAPARNTLPPPPVPMNADLIEGLAAGQSANIVLDRCPSPAPAGLGSLICGENYRLYWDAQTGRWFANGPNKLLPLENGFDATLGKYPGRPPKDRIAIVWGLWLTLNEDQSISMEKGPVVGTLRHVQPSQIGEPISSSAADQVSTPSTKVSK